MRSVLDLQLLAPLLRKRLVVGHLEDDVRNRVSELRAELFFRRIGVFDGVVKDGSLQDDEFVDAAGRGEQARERDGGARPPRSSP